MGSVVAWVLFLAAVGVILVAIGVAIRDGQRGWAAGITLTAAVGFGILPGLLAVPVVLAIVYLAQIRRRLRA